MRWRIWSETLAFADYYQPEVMALLRRYQLTVCVAVRPWELEAVPALVHAYAAAGLPLALWPMLADEDGRWLSVDSWGRFVGFADRLTAAAPGVELILDLEPAFERLRNWKALRAMPTQHPWSWRAHWDHYHATRDEMVVAVTRWGQTRRVSTAVIPLVALEPSPRWGRLAQAQPAQRLLGTPVDDLPVASHSVMAYTSMFEGWSRGLVDRRRAEALLRLCAARAVRRWGARASLSLGTLGPGAFGDEPCYRGPHELARDIELARAAGLQELALFELGALLKRPNIGQWLAPLGA